MSSVLPIVHVISNEEAQGEVKALFEKLIAKNGKVPAWMRVMANCNDILLSFFALFKATMDNSPLNSKLKWKLAYHISELNKCEFCVSVTEMQLESMGVSSQEIAEIKEKLVGRDAVALEYAVAVNNHAYKLDEDLLSRVKTEFSDEELVELTSVVGLFNYINRFNDALGVLPNMD